MHIADAQQTLDVGVVGVFAEWIDKEKNRLDLMKGSVETAVTSLRKLITNDDTLAPAHRMLGAANIGQQNFEQARRELAWLDNHADKRGELRSALASLERVAANNPDNAEHWIDSGAVQLALGESSLARKVFRTRI